MITITQNRNDPKQTKRNGLPMEIEEIKQRHNLEIQLYTLLRKKDDQQVTKISEKTKPGFESIKITKKKRKEN